MRIRSVCLVVALLAPIVTGAQHNGAQQPRASLTAPPEAAQFDFLIGQWELTVTPKVSTLAAKIHGAPKMLGTWKAWRAFDGWGIEDELRILDRSGNPQSLNQSLRVYDAGAAQWSQTNLDVYRARYAASTAQWVNGEMRVNGRGQDQEGKPVLSRTRFYAITGTSFRFVTDRSHDEGKTWDEGVLRIEAKRVSATAAR